MKAKTKEKQTIESLMLNEERTFLAINEDVKAGDIEDLKEWLEETTELLQLGEYRFNILKMQKPTELEILKAKTLVIYSQLMELVKDDDEKDLERHLEESDDLYFLGDIQFQILKLGHKDIAEKEVNEYESGRGVSLMFY